ncbi:hypothetical protein ACFRCW_39485 [Streptomyces sp. NPDC056653]
MRGKPLGGGRKKAKGDRASGDLSSGRGISVRCTEPIPYDV